MTATLAELQATFAGTGTVEAILLRPGHREEVVSVDTVDVLADRGLDGDRRAATATPDGGRHVTLVQAEHLEVVAALLGRPIAAEAVRRNLVVRGINLAALRERRFRIGDAVLEGTGHCHPCSRMEEVLGTGGYTAMRGHGGITTRVVEPGTIEVGATVAAI